MRIRRPSLIRGAEGKIMPSEKLKNRPRGCYTNYAGGRPRKRIKYYMGGSKMNRTIFSLIFFAMASVSSAYENWNLKARS